MTHTDTHSLSSANWFTLCNNYMMILNNTKNNNFIFKNKRSVSKSVL